MLSIIKTDYESYIITGDCNIQVDNNSDSTSREFMAVLDTFNLSQHVSGPTHSRGHTLDLVISKGVNIPAVNVMDVALSDHFCVFFDGLFTPSTHSICKTIHKRYFNDNTRTVF